MQGLRLSSWQRSISPLWGASFAGVYLPNNGGTTPSAVEGILLWSLLGVCALIAVKQLIPAIKELWILSRGTAQRREDPVEGLDRES